MANSIYGKRMVREYYGSGTGVVRELCESGARLVGEWHESHERVVREWYERLPSSVTPVLDEVLRLRPLHCDIYSWRWHRAHSTRHRARSTSAAGIYKANAPGRKAPGTTAECTCLNEFLVNMSCYYFIRTSYESGSIWTCLISG